MRLKEASCTIRVIPLFLMLFACTQGVDTMKPQENITKEDLQHASNATFAGGCFWCMEPPFENAPGVLAVYSGYTGGDVDSPTYDQVSSGATGHFEAIEVLYDPTRISYEDLLTIFWRNVDPTDEGGQFGDRGQQYSTAIFYHTEEQKQLAQKSRDEIGKQFDKPIATNILSYDEFFLAEDYHQGYYKKNPIRYTAYRKFSGRDQFLEQTWGDTPHGKEAHKLLDEPFTKPRDEELKELLTPLQYEVTQKAGTEPAYDNKYHDNKEEGIYVDLVSGDALFSTTHQYDSKTGWPSFTQPIHEDAVTTKRDFKLLLPRTAVSSAQANSHLGHVFSDGPQPTGLRYCMNSAALRFVHKDDLEQEGYSDYLYLFEEK